MPSEFDSLLRRALARPSAPVDEARRDADLDALVAAHARRHPPRASRWSRWLLAGGLLSAAAVGACAVPVDYEAEVGQRIAFVIDASHFDEVDVEAIARYVETTYAPEELRIGARMEQKRVVDDDGSETVTSDVRIELDAVGDHLDADVLWDDLVDEFPALGDARREDEALHGLVHGTLGGRLSMAWLDVTIDRDGVDEAKRQLVEQLTAQGYQGTPDVEILDEDLGDGHHRREVRVRLEHEQ